MKLIDLLVQELPKRGGWPEGVVKIHQDYDGETWAWLNHDSTELLFTLNHVAANARKFGKSEKCENMVTREEYESALAASQKIAWNGEGVPAVGCECEARLRCSDGEWFFFRCVGVDCGVAFGWAGKEAVTLGKGSYEFRPLRTEAERKRDAAVEKIKELLVFDYGDDPRVNDATFIYDAIAAGKIPGVKLDD